MRHQSILEQAILILKKQGIEITDTSDVTFTEGVTNTFKKLIDSRGNKYLLRLNGELWPPFTRENEDRNLQQLQSDKIHLLVIYSDPKNEFQISLLPNERKRLDFIKKQREVGDAINLVAYKIRKLHNGNYFSNNFDLPKVLEDSFNRLSTKQQIQSQLHFQFILRIVNALRYQQDFVPSHNDLLPSSIYIDQNNTDFVDFEYSGNNTRAYDIALLSIKSEFTDQEEARLISCYDPQRALNIEDALITTKPVVHFLLFLWHKNACHAKCNEQSPAFVRFFISCQKLLWEQSGKMFHKENQLTEAHSKSVGIYWGTFDPPTLAHLNIAITAIQKCNISKLIIVINDNSNTGKKYNISAEVRQKLWQSMFYDISIHTNLKDCISIICQTDKNPFSYQTAKEQHPEQQVVAIVGQDSFNGFKQYKSTFSSYDHILVAPRNNQNVLLIHDINELGVNNVSILPVDHTYMSISSTQARDALNARHHGIVQTQLHRSVIDNLYQNGLFRQASNQCSRLIPSVKTLNI